ncbi:MAG: hypothetical protein WC307_07265 [Candidatus Nanoarchaeia archaeon]|jgi:hypothetical protein
MNKLLLILFVLLTISISFCAYLGGRQVFLTDQFYINLPDSRGIIDCFEFNCLNGTCLLCSYGVNRAGLVYVDSRISLGSDCEVLKEDSIDVYSPDPSIYFNNE